MPVKALNMYAMHSFYMLHMNQCASVSLFIFRTKKEVDDGSLKTVIAIPEHSLSENIAAVLARGYLADYIL